MTKQELLKVGKLIEAIVKKEVTAATKPLLAEVKLLKHLAEDQKSMFGQMIVEQMNTSKPQPPPLNDVIQGNGSGYVAEQSSARRSDNYYADKAASGGSSPLYSILANTTPLSESDQSSAGESILDIPVEQLDELDTPAAKMLKNVLNPEKLKRTLGIMERAAGVHKNSSANKSGS